MVKQIDKASANGDVKEPSLHVEMPSEQASCEDVEIKGWALKWDTMALRKVNMARKMRGLRHPEVDQ